MDCFRVSNVTSDILCVITVYEPDAEECIDPKPKRGTLVKCYEGLIVCEKGEIIPEPGIVSGRILLGLGRQICKYL